MEKHNDIPYPKILDEMERLIAQGFKVYLKFTCENCGSRQTVETPNAYFTEGYICEECGVTTYPNEFGMLVIQ